MADTEEKKETVVETPAVEAPTSPVEEQKQEVSQSSQAQPSLKEGEKREQTRLEKRIKELEEKDAGIKSVLSKLKGQERVEKENIPPWMMQGEEPLIRPEEIEQGISPEDLEKRIQSRVERAKLEAVNEAMQRMQFRDVVKEHLIDVETSKDRFPELKNPDFEREVSELYDLYNTVYNPITNQKEFVPAVKFSEVCKRVKEKWERLATQGVIQAREKITEQVSSSAVPPSSSITQSEPSVEDLRKNLWSNPQQVARELAKRLKVEE